MFSKSTISFLNQLGKNNNKDWFDKNKHRYEKDVREVALEFIESLAQPMAKISPHFVVSPKKTGGSLMRIYKDVRFSKDKTPYKTNIGINFRHERGRDVHAPGFYLHIEPKEVFIGAGIWRPDSGTLNNVRMLINDEQVKWKRLQKQLLDKHGFELGGEQLKRPPKGYAADHPLIDTLKRKDFIAIKNLPVASIYDGNFNREVAHCFKLASPLVKFICAADDLAF